MLRGSQCWLLAWVLLTCGVGSLADCRKFPPGFLLGASTAAYQIEGAWNISGKGENVWDYMMLTKPNHTFDHQWGDVACDSYHLIQRDVEMLREIGMDVYRFSLSWSRLLPTGFVDVINPDGVRYYNELIDTLLAHGITPMVTLFHWDLPQVLQDLGGWPNPELADYFFDYADTVFGLFGDRVKLWITFNEPHQYCKQSYSTGNNAPAINRTGLAEYKCGHTILRSHAKVYHLYKQKYAAQKGKISITLDSEWYEPKNPYWPPDVVAAERRMEFELGWFAHPIFTRCGGYPPIMVKRIAEESKAQGLRRSRLPSFTKEERAALIGSADFFALNHYTTYLVENQMDNSDWLTPSREQDMSVLESCDPSWKKSEVVDIFKIVPWGFRKLLNWIRVHYNNPPVHVTENGFPDAGELADTDRVRYFSEYLEALLDAIYVDKCNVIGYTVWSLMDNFEWRFGYTARYGLYSVNFTDPARTRTPKLSAKFFAKLTRTRELPCVIDNPFIESSPNEAENKTVIQSSECLDRRCNDTGTTIAPVTALTATSPASARTNPTVWFRSSPFIPLYNHRSYPIAPNFGGQLWLRPIPQPSPPHVFNSGLQHPYVPVHPQARARPQSFGFGHPTFRGVHLYSPSP